jgi:probable phosphoglycerate mutase
LADVNGPFPVVYLVGESETAWSLTGQHIGSKDLPLIERGERNALRLKERLRGLAFTKVLSGPLQRATKTCELAGFGPLCEVDPDLADWDCGRYEGLTAREIQKQRPSWDLFRDGCPGGESALDIAARAGRVLGRLRSIDGNVLVFSSLCFIRVLGACWISMDDAFLGSRLMLSAGSLSALGYENSFSNPVIRFWNDAHHVGG